MFLNRKLTKVYFLYLSGLESYKVFLFKHSDHFFLLPVMACSQKFAVSDYAVRTIFLFSPFQS